MPRYTQIVILCEERQQEVFARHFLVSCGVNRHRIRAEVAPAGLGSGERYVRRRYPQEVQAYRRHCHHKNIALAVLIDADVGQVKERLRQLARELAENRHNPPPDSAPDSLKIACDELSRIL